MKTDNPIYIGLDTSHKMGVAVWLPRSQTSFVTECKGTPIQQVSYILANNIYRDYRFNTIFVMEKLHNFLNANTTRSLLERYGYIKYSLIKKKLRLEEVSPGVARKYFGCKTKGEMHTYFLLSYYGDEFTNNHSDALAIAIYQSVQDGFEYKPEQLVIKQGEEKECQPG